MAQSREQARLAERRRQERRAARKAESLQQRKLYSVIGAVVAVALVIGGIVAIQLFKKDNNKDNSVPPGSASSSTVSPSVQPSTPGPSPSAAAGVACGATAPPAAAAAQTFKAEPPMTIDTKAKYVATLTTSCGKVDVVMDPAKIPHTVNSWAFLAGKKFWDGTRCHRMTSGGLNVLQCGDPTATGSGGPGYKFVDENLAGSTYPKGSVAMANSGPNTNGSQFFINYADSTLDANYTVVGQVTPETLAVLDKIKAVGVVPTADGQTTQPAQQIFLDTVTVTKKA